MRGLTDPSQKAVTCGPTPPISANGPQGPQQAARSTRNPSPPAPHSVHARITWQPPTATATRSTGAEGSTGGEDRWVTLHPLRSDKDPVGAIQPVGAGKSSDQQHHPGSMRDGIGNCPNRASPFVLISNRCLSYGRKGRRRVRINPPVCSGWRNASFPRCSSSSSSAGCWSGSC